MVKALPTNLLFFLAPVALIAVALAISWIVTKRRRKAYETFCLERGYRFDPRRPGEERRNPATCPLFSEGHGRCWTFTISGTSGGTPFTAFEYEWTTGGGRSSQRHSIGGLLWSCERELPQFVVTPEGFWAKIAAYFGGQDIDFPDSPQFSSAYRLQGSDEPAVRTLFTPTRRQAFELVPGQHAAGSGRELMWWRNGTLPAPDEFDAFLMEGDRIRLVFARD
jgi:hypothetical protein